MTMLDILANPNLIARIRLIVYTVLICFSFFIIIGVAEMKAEYEDECPLFKDSLSNPPVSNCNFPMAIAIMFQLIFLLFRLVLVLLLMTGKLHSESVLASDMMEFAWVVTEFFGFLLTFIGACVLSAGFNETCDLYDKLLRCSDQDFYTPAQVAQAGAWISTFLWIFIFVVGFISLWRSGKIPFLGGGASTSTGANHGAEPTHTPKMDTPPSNPELDVSQPKY